MKAKERVRNDDGPREVTPAGRSVFHDLFEAEEAIELEVRSTLLRGLEQWLANSGMTQTDAAKTLGVTQARISEIKRGKISRFSIDLLFRLAARAGLHPKVKLAA
jgi:predicted XRE-type DNA-binding protein